MSNSVKMASLPQPTKPWLTKYSDPDTFMYLLHYLGLKEIQKLDSAWTNRSTRQFFLEILRNMPKMYLTLFNKVIPIPKTCFTNRVAVNNPNCFLQPYRWLISREIPIREISFVRQKLTMEEYSQLFKRISPYLEKFDLSFAKKIRLPQIFALCRRCPLLRKINLTWCERITDECVRIIVEGLPMLEEIHLSNCKKITDNSLRLISRLPNLKALYLMNNHAISNAGLQFLRMPTLETLYIHNLPLITDVGVCSIHSPNLFYLRITGCLITDEIVPFFQNHPALKYINLESSVNISNISDICLIELSIRCPNLKSLTLLGNDISDESLFALANNNPYLTHISFHYCNNITDAGVLRLLDTHPLMEDVVFYWCSQLTDNVLFKMAGNKFLKKIDLGRTLITDEGLIHFTLYGQSHITDINLSLCSITDYAMSKLIIRYANSLMGIGMSKCENISRRMIDIILKYCANISYILADEQILPDNVREDYGNILFLNDLQFGRLFKLPRF